MLRFLALVLLITSLHSSNKFELIAKQIVVEGNSTTATGGVVVISDEFYINANRAHYNNETGILEIFENVTMFSTKEMRSHLEYLKFDSKNEIFFSENIFLIDKISQQWFASHKIEFHNEYLELGPTTLSSCDVENPDWKFTISSGIYDTENMWAHIFNPVLYLYDKPVFYLPYFAFPTDDRRQTGILNPSFGILESDGISFIQPVFFAPYLNWDLEVDPQIREKRGAGLYATFRYKDTPYSIFKLSGGYFNDDSDYTSKYSLANSEHYGYNIYYNSSHVFSDKDKLLIDFTYFNDTEYFTLQNISSNSITYDENITSTLNYIYNDDKIYVGLYPRYFISTTTNDNSATLQLIPHVQLHKFSAPFFIDNIIYSIDLRSKNYTRTNGLTATLNEMLMPAGFYLSLYDYVKLSISENVYIANVTTKNTTDTEGNLTRLFTKANFDIDLVKEYDSFLHIWQMGGYIVEPTYEIQSGTIPNINVDETSELSDEDTDFLTYLNQNKSLNLYMYNYFYPDELLKEITIRSIIPFEYDESVSNYSLKYIYNDFNFAFNEYVSFTNSIKYAYENKYLASSTSVINFSTDNTKLSFSHSMTNTAENDLSEYYKSSFEQKLGYNYNIFGNISYDNVEQSVRSYLLGISMKKQCWDYKLQLQRTITPTLQSSGDIISIVNQIIYFSINLVPMYSFDYSFVDKFEDN